MRRIGQVVSGEHIRYLTGSRHQPPPRRVNIDQIGGTASSVFDVFANLPAIDAEPL
jgi:hypothetical protein